MHRRLLFTKLLLVTVLALALPFFTLDVFAKVETGTPSTPELSPCATYMCYSQYNPPGGVAWAYYAFSGNSKVVNFSSISGLYPTRSDTWDCNLENTDGAFFLTKLWYYADSYSFADKLFGPVLKNSVQYEYNVRNPGYSSGNVSTVDASQAYNAWKASYEPQSAADSKWSEGNFSVFCGNLNNYISKTNAYSPYNDELVTSNWVDGATDEYLEIDAQAGDTVTVHLNQIIQATSALPNKTDWEVNRSDRATHSGVIYEDTSYGGSGSSFASLSQYPHSGTLSTADENPHSLPDPTSGGNHRVNITLPAEDKTSYSIIFCEEIKYQGGNKYDPSNPKNKSSHACVKINVSPNGEPVEIPSTTSCPLPYYTPPAAGTIAHGDTESESGAKTQDQTWNKSIYSKPTDVITFAHCVNPEAQAVKKTKEITEGHGKPCNDVYDDHDEWVLDDNWFQIDTENVKKRSNESGSLGLIMNPQAISFTSSPSFSVGGEGYSVKFTGTPHKTTAAVVYSSSTYRYDVKMGSAGGFIKQEVTTDVSYADENKTPVDSWTASACSCCQKCTCTCKNGGSCCCSCPCNPQKHTHWYYPGKYEDDNSPSSAWVYIPYNFTTSGTTDIVQYNTTTAQKQVVLPDESFELTASISILPRKNAATSPAGSPTTYATEPPADTKVEVVTFYMPSQSVPSGGVVETSSVCSYFSGKYKALNCETVGNYGNRDAWMSSYPAYKSGGTYTFNFSRKVENVPDGYLLCSSIGISHNDSLNDTNNDAAGDVDNRWNIIGPTCRSVANIPNTQVWGGSLLTNGHIKTSSTFKTSVSGRTFGSWVEFATIAGGAFGSIEGMGSGASLGYIDSYSVNSRDGGNSNSLFYVRTPLAISNSNCVSDNGCTSVSPSGITSNSTIMSRLITRFISNTGATSNVTGGSISLSDPSSYISRDGNRITHASGDITITSAPTLAIDSATDNGTTHIIYAEGDITISTDLLYDKDANYTKISQIPQYVIIAGKNINISSNVQEIDAWLIAENGSIDTCAGKTIGSSVDSTAGCGNQLVVNGPIITQSISPKRAYGAGAQDSSGGAVGTYTDQFNVTGAEVFNLSIYSYLWAFAQAYRTTEPHTVYTRILAPRL